MCGINGLTHHPQGQSIVQAMNDRLAHRGPDAEGIWHDNRLTLGHRRLSIIDLSERAHQPMAKNGLVICYNGEIYNYRELRSSLEGEGARFVTSSDTEVVLELFRRYRERSFERLLGMFALALYDTATTELFLARDHFGIKPLFYTHLDTEHLAFSSELKALCLLPGIRARVNPRALIGAVNYLWPDCAESAITGIHKLPPAHYLRTTLAEKTPPVIQRYWTLRARPQQRSLRAAIEGTRAVIDESVKRHLVADVPVGAFLSGGLDSSLITALAKRLNNDITTYTIRIRDRENRIERMPDDARYARAFARERGIRHHEIEVTPNAIEYLRAMVKSLDEPIGDPAAINTYLICRAARTYGIKVLLSGMGADELFGGYRRHYATLIAQCFARLPAPIRTLARSIIGTLPVRAGERGIVPVRWAKRFLSFASLPVDEAYLRSYSYYDRDALAALFMNRYTEARADLYAAHHRVFTAQKEFDTINKMCYTDIHLFMTGLNLAYTDRASMAASVEVRVPFIDREVAEWAMSLTGAFKIRGTCSKYVLRKASEGILPRQITRRPKASFGMPLRAWVTNDLAELIGDTLSERSLRQRGIFDPAIVRRMIDEDRRGVNDHAYALYQLLTCELWMREYIDGH